MRRNAALVLTAIVAVGVVTAGVVAATTGSPAATPHAQNATTIDVTASGSVSAEPDVAVLSVAVVAQADSADAARAAVAENASSLRDALADAGIAKADIETTTYRVSEQTQKSGEKPDTATRFQAVHGFKVTVQDSSRAGAVLDAAVAGGANRVHGVQFTLSDETRADLREQAIEAAMADARSQASAVAAAENLTITGLKSASVGGGYGGPVLYASASGDAGGAKTTIDRGPVSVTVTVQATYTAN
ncbi:SIMPL domain-containing protein [Halarchaeum sp. P4]|uniref:SIMPL domain-containing protein n=1 Tax=Halarchaeum sp. P4 TaxID=3421639 RepID=UPI003EC0B04E